MPPKYDDYILGQPKKGMRIIRRRVLPLVTQQEEVRSHTMGNEVRVSAALKLTCSL